MSPTGSSNLYYQDATLPGRRGVCYLLSGALGRVEVLGGLGGGREASLIGAVKVIH